MSGTAPDLMANLRASLEHAKQARLDRNAHAEAAVEASADMLYNADPDCEHEIVEQWSGVKCAKCPGWFCW